MPTSTVCCPPSERYMERQKQMVDRLAKGMPQKRYLRGKSSSFGIPRRKKRNIMVAPYRMLMPAARPKDSVMLRIRPTLIPQPAGAVKPISVALIWPFAIIAVSANRNLIGSLFRLSGWRSHGKLWKGRSCQKGSRALKRQICNTALSGKVKPFSARAIRFAPCSRYRTGSARTSPGGTICKSGIQRAPLLTSTKCPGESSLHAPSGSIVPGAWGMIFLERS